VIRLFSKRRSKLDLYFGVLKSIKEGNNKVPQIMREVNIPWKTLEKILSSLIKNSIIEEIDADYINDGRTSVFYILTIKGNKIYDYFRNTKNQTNHILYLLT
jgi:predicted transcriptional regulator